MTSYPSFSVTDDELEQSARSSEHSFDYTNSIDRCDVTSSTKRSRKSPSCEQYPRKRRKLNDRNPCLACPFAKHDPLRHRQCFRYNKMDQVSRLKQHLLRVHQVPIHCVRCSQTFTSEDERDTHLRSIPGCTVRVTQIHLGITETQKAQLAQRVSAKKTKQENWYMIYDILFPGSPKPDTPYLDGTQFAEELFAVREFAVRKAPTRIAQLASALQNDGGCSPLFQEFKLHIEAFAFAAVKDAFDAVVDQWLRGDLPSKELERATPVTQTHSVLSTSPTLPSVVALDKVHAAPIHTSLGLEASSVQSHDEIGTFGHLLSFGSEGTRSWGGLEEPSRLDWLSMVANMNSKSWDEHLNNCLDSAVQQPLK